MNYETGEQPLEYRTHPFRRFSTRMWQKARVVNTVRRAMMCDKYFFLKFYNFIKGIVFIYIAF